MSLEVGIAIGRVAAVYRYPVKSMRGERLDQSRVTWTGIEGDRRYAFVRADDSGHFPWLTARQVPRMLLYQPRCLDPDRPAASEVVVRTPDGCFLPVDSTDLHDEIAGCYLPGAHLMHLGRGAYDSAPISLISTATLRGLGAWLESDLDPRRFRPNLVLDLADALPYAEESWLGGLLVFGDRADSARVRLQRRNQRCVMITLDPETGDAEPSILRTVAATRESCAGIYGVPENLGTMRAGDLIYLIRP
jgi:hypothetical protein